MLKRRKILAVVLLLTVNALLLFHDVATNRLFCFKTDGSMNLEVALFDFHCMCKESEEDDHHHAHPVPHPKMCQDEDTCCDQPFGGGWLERELVPDPEGARFVKHHPISINDDNQPDDAFGSFFEQLPLRKFLDGVPPHLRSTILRC